MSEELFEIRRRMDEKLGSVISAPDEDIKNKLHSLSLERFLLPLMLGSSERLPNEEELYTKARELGIVEDGKTARFCVLVSKYADNEGNQCTEEKHTDFVDTVLAH